MIFEIELSDQADADLRNIYEYIAFKLQSPENALRQLNHLENRITTLDKMPERFRKYEDEPWHSRGLHIMPVDNYCVFYIPNTENAIVTILRVMYAGQNIDAELTNYTKQ